MANSLDMPNCFILISHPISNKYFKTNRM